MIVLVFGKKECWYCKRTIETGETAAKTDAGHACTDEVACHKRFLARYGLRGISTVTAPLQPLPQ